ncbi:MAG: ribosome small subunit-dependent GTPase A [Spirochaetaceae bacterium]
MRTQRDKAPSTKAADSSTTAHSAKAMDSQQGVHTKEGLVLYGTNNIFTVISENERFLCRIKGKVLKQEETSYNPLAPGDTVLFIPSNPSDGKGLITERVNRKNAFIRWNRKKASPQTVAANIDIVMCVASIGTPPFRPRFIDRVLVAAGNIPAAVVINKDDLAGQAWEEERIEDFSRIGYPVYRSSAETGKGIEDLKTLVSGKRSVWVGQSGVGKSSLLNHIIPGGGLETGEVSVKYDRGRHTTKNGRLYFTPGAEVIDTPGIRQIELHDILPEELQNHFPEFLPYVGECAFQPCSHREEPDCRVKAAVEEGLIHSDRYVSYIRIYEELYERTH